MELSPTKVEMSSIHDDLIRVLYGLMKVKINNVKTSLYNHTILFDILLHVFIFKYLYVYCTIFKFHVTDNLWWPILGCLNDTRKISKWSNQSWQSNTPVVCTMCCHPWLVALVEPCQQDKCNQDDWSCEPDVVLQLANQNAAGNMIMTLIYHD